MRIGIDTGGTFTDFVYISGSQRKAFKRSTLKDSPSESALDGVREILDSTESTYRILSAGYGTTTATNALLTRSGARTVLITTKGFEDVIEIGRQNRPSLYVLSPELPEPLIPQNLRLGIGERIGASGEVHTHLTRAEIERTINNVRRLKPQAIAVCLLHSYKNPSHEIALANAIFAEFGESVPVFVSSELDSYPREYERTGTTAIHAFLSSPVRKSAESLPRNLASLLRKKQSDFSTAKAGSGVSVDLLTSNGGTCTVERAIKRPADLVLSGPAAGVIAAAEIARRASVRNFIGFDMGGTSTDVCLGLNGAVAENLGRDFDGLPLRTPRLAVYTIGAGGGSIAKRGIGGALSVGPESAGSDPGPAAYGKGEFVTVTDADFYLGLLPQDLLLCGEFAIDSRRSSDYIKELGATLGISADETAEGIVKIVNLKMAGAVRHVSQSAGFDPRGFTLIPFGGIGAVHACAVAGLVGIANILVPPQAGCLSALGAFIAQKRMDETVTVLMNDSFFLKHSPKVYADIEKRIESELGKNCTMRREVMARYPGQGYELAVPFTKNIRETFAEFHAMHYGFSKPDSPVEIVAVKVAAVVPAKQNTAVWNFEETRSVRETGRSIEIGMKLKPLTHIIDNTATTYIGEGWTGFIDDFGNVRLSRRG